MCSPGLDLVSTLSILLYASREKSLLLSKIIGETYCEKIYEREGINYFWSIKNSTEILNKLKAKRFQASTISTYNFLRFKLRYNTIGLKSTCLGVKKFLIWPAVKNELFVASEEH